jgi:hypothetical protein
MFSASKTAAPVSGSFQVSNSLRFRSSASAYLNRTFGTNGSSTTTKTLSFWVKRGGSNSSFYYLFSGYDGSSGNDLFVGFDSSGSYVADGFRVSCGGAAAYDIVTSSVYRDFSAWYHFVVAFDTTQATASNRVKIYVNGSQLTAFNTANYPAQNSVIGFGFGNSYNKIGSTYLANTRYFDGYMAEINFIDGQALTPSSFGSINATTGVWQPARYTGSYGTNGFYLKFNNGTSTTTLGNDSSGNGNNWTTNNISLTAGSTYDWMIDSPTSYAGSSYGVGNYAVLNPLQSTTPPRQGNIAFLGTAGSYVDSVYGSIGVSSSGKYYFEVLGAYIVGVNNSAVNVSTDQQTGRIVYHGGVGEIKNGSTVLQSGLPTVTSTDVVSVALNLDAGTLAFYKNNSQLGTNVSISAINTWWPFLQNANGDTNYVNFGQRPFSYTPPTGYKSLCTQNLPAPTIYNGANHMAATTYTGTGSSLSISNSVNSASFQPDLVWIKSRSAATDHKLTDSVRGVTKGLISNTTGAETTDTTGLTAFGASGFTVGASTTYNNSGATYVGWQWKAGGTAVSNTSGTITSSVSANTTAGFSVVTYTGSNVTSTVGHGLGVAPSFIIAKIRTTTDVWVCYHASLGKDSYLILNQTDAAGTLTNYWGVSAPTSSVYGVTGSGGVGYSNNRGNVVAYCFAAIAGYSAFGSYTGNGSTDGPFVYCGFRPRFILIKGSSFVSNWFIEDSSRNGYNVNSGVALRPNLNNAEDGTTTYDLDILSNGFKLKSSSGDSNSSGATFIYAAFAENPFQNALAR